MLKLMMSGAILLVGCSCISVPTLKKPVRMYQIRLSNESVAVGDRSFNIKKGVKQSAELITPPFFIGIDEAPNDLMCFSLKTYLKVIKPKIKEGAQAYEDYKDAK